MWWEKEGKFGIKLPPHADQYNQNVNVRTAKRYHPLAVNGWCVLSCDNPVPLSSCLDFFSFFSRFYFQTIIMESNLYTLLSVEAEETISVSSRCLESAPSTCHNSFPNFSSRWFKSLRNFIWYVLWIRSNTDQLQVVFSNLWGKIDGICDFNKICQKFHFH